MNRIKLFEEFVSEKIITINWLDDESSLVFSDVGPIRVDYDGDFKYRNKVFSTAENQGPEDLIQDLSAAFKGDKFVYEKLSVVGGLAKEILNAILPATMFPANVLGPCTHKSPVIPAPPPLDTTNAPVV